MSIDTVLLIVAAVCFVLATLSARISFLSDFNLVAAGLFFWVLSILIR